MAGMFDAGWESFRGNCLARSERREARRKKRKETTCYNEIEERWKGWVSIAQHL